MATIKYLSKRNAAEWLDVSEKTIDRLRTSGELDSIKVTDPERPRPHQCRLTRGQYGAAAAEDRTRRSGGRLPGSALDELRARKAASRPAEAVA